MSYINPELNERYLGYSRTKPLWLGKAFYGLRQFQFEPINYEFQRTLDKKLRLGQLAEQFVFNDLETSPDYEIISENLQVRNLGLTIGELDVIIREKTRTYHVEIVYKFYCYDESLGVSEIERWVGPNRSDSLLEKVEKLKEKQLPLLYSPYSKPLLEELNLKANEISQATLFKAQLFLPYKTEIHFEELNHECVHGFFINRDQLSDFKTNEFYIPKKLDWFLDPHYNVEWMNYSELINSTESYLDSERSPLIWIKNNQELSKAFLVWW